MRPRSVSLRVKIGLVFGLTFFGCFAGAAVYLYAHLRTVLIGQNDRTLTDRAALLSERTSVYPLVIPLPAPGEALAIWQTDDSFRRQLYRSPNFPEAVAPSDTERVIEADTLRIAWSVQTLNDESGRVVLAVGQSSRPLQRELTQVGWLLAITLFISVLTSGVTAYVLSGVLLRPLRTVIRRAQTLNVTEQYEPLPVPASGDELQELSETINAMLTRIRRAIDGQQNFFASASHELRTPLSILRAELEVALNNNPGDRERGLLQSQLDELRRLSRLVDDLLLMSQYRAGTLTIRPEPVALDDLTLALVERYQQRLTERSLFLNIQLPDTNEPLTVTADRDKLTNVLVNLLDNAIKYALPNTTVTLQINGTADHVDWSLTNTTTAVLLDPALLTREFYRADTLREGYGLGLWISSQLVRLQGGQLSLHQIGDQFRVRVVLPAPSSQRGYTGLATGS